MARKNLSQISSKYHLIAMLFVLFFLDGFALWYAARTDYRNTFEKTRNELQKTALSLEERIKRTITATELILSTLAERIEEKGVDEFSSSIDEWNRFRRYSAALPDPGTLWLLDKNGDCVLASTDFPVQRVNFSEREYFKPQRDSGIVNYVGPVVKGRIVKKYSFTISRRISGKDGSFQGIVLAAIDTDDFTNFLRNISIGEGAAVTVWRTDGTMILRQPMEDRFIGTKFADLSLFKSPHSEQKEGSFVNTGVDGMVRLVGFKKLDTESLIAVTSVSMDGVKDQWLGRVIGYSTVAAFAFLALLGLAWLVYRSISREEKVRSELKEYTAKLEQSNQALRDFASIASHDLQEPLRKVTSFSNMLQSNYESALDDRGREYLKRICGATERMQSLIVALLEYSRISTRGEPFKDVALTPLVEEVIGDLEVSIARTGGKVEVGNLPPVKGDPMQMRQLFQNLIGNSLKFSKEGEKPVVKVRCTKSDGPNCHILVEDNGIGFEQEFADKIFAPFQRLHGRSSPYPGTGMGLAICKKIVERHGGSISAKSRPGNGATFIIELPEAGIEDEALRKS